MEKVDLDDIVFSLVFLFKTYSQDKILCTGEKFAVNATVINQV